MADVHRLGDIRGAEINDDGARLCSGRKKQVLARDGFIETGAEGSGRQAEIQEAGAGDFDFLTERGHVEFRHDIGGELAGIQCSSFSDGNQGIALVIAKFRIRARADEHGADVGVREDGADGGLEGGFDLFVW